MFKRIEEGLGGEEVENEACSETQRQRWQGAVQPRQQFSEWPLMASALWFCPTQKLYTLQPPELALLLLVSVTLDKSPNLSVPQFSLS